MKVTIRRKLRQFEFELELWNFEAAFRIIKEFNDFPDNARHLINYLMCQHGNCGSQRSGYAYVGVPKTLKTIMEIANPWLSSKKGKKPKAIAV